MPPVLSLVSTSFILANIDQTTYGQRNDTFPPLHSGIESRSHTYDPRYIHLPRGMFHLELELGQTLRAKLMQPSPQCIPLIMVVHGTFFAFAPRSSISASVKS